METRGGSEKRNFKEENVSIDSDRSKNNRESFSCWRTELNAIRDGLATIGTRGKEFLGKRRLRIPVENCSNVRSIGYAIFDRVGRISASRKNSIGSFSNRIRVGRLRVIDIKTRIKKDIDRFLADSDGENLN